MVLNPELHCRIPSRPLLNLNLGSNMITKDSKKSRDGVKTFEMLSLKLGDRCLRVVVVAMVVVVSMIVVDMSDTASGVADVVSVVSTEKESPTKRRFPSTCTLGSFSAASFSTCRPL